MNLAKSILKLYESEYYLDKKMEEFVRLILKLKHPRISKTDISNVWDENSVEVYVRYENLDAHFTIDLIKGEFHWVDFETDLELGNTPAEAAKSFSVLLDNRITNKVLRRK